MTKMVQTTKNDEIIYEWPTTSIMDMLNMTFRMFEHLLYTSADLTCKTASFTDIVTYVCWSGTGLKKSQHNQS